MFSALSILSRGNWFKYSPLGYQIPHWQLRESGEDKDMKRKFDLTPIPSEDSVFGALEDVFPEVVMEEVPVFEDVPWSRNGLEVWSHLPVVCG